MPGLVAFVVGAVMILGGLGAVVAASDGHTSTAPGTTRFVGGAILMALGRVIYALGDILTALKSAKA